MATSLGKRKRASTTATIKANPRSAAIEEKSDNEDLQAIFKRAFEAKFKPLPEAPAKAVVAEVLATEDDEEIDEDESDWSGISEPEEATIEVVEHAPIARTEKLDRQQLKAFMSSKPPSTQSRPLSTISKSAATPTEDDNTDAANLKNDLALQRLLTESHLLDSSFSSTDPSGKNRHRATDLRLLSLGSKASVLEQKNMPLSHRKGILAKAAQKENSRRSEAKENGIILERVTKIGAKKALPERRERGLGGPSVGRFKGGTLKLSKSDVSGINGPRMTSGGKGGKSKRRK
ncbi:hypothetical protein BT93_L0698 [Corymbia citriodora subsp. variegata]|uniref:Uncharacterized protein n=1 Tax=Corymbia citriodora subsp. variegata TaxID=360336 RepID=A0A8T0CGD8_CORYI|nr:hypothetical protein BT93_L0698 [Corymbia citriodora subsp. variegata]